MAIEFSCQECKAELFVPEEFAGRRGACHACGAQVTAPESAEVAPVSPPTAEPIASSGSASTDTPPPSPPPVADEVGEGLGAAESPPPRLERWAVLLGLDAAVAIDPVTHAGVLAKAMGLAQMDVARAIRASQGILTRTLDADSAVRVRRELTARKMSSVAVLTADLVSLPAQTRARKLEWDDSHLHVYIDIERPPVAVAWESIRCVHRGWLAKPLAGRGKSSGAVTVSPMGRMAKGASAALAGSSASLRAFGQEAADIEPLAELVSDSPLMLIHLSPQFLDFAVLGEDRQATADPNLRTLLDRLLAYCRHALIDGPDLVPPSSDLLQRCTAMSPEAFERRTEWLLNVALHLRPQAGVQLGS